MRRRLRYFIGQTRDILAIMPVILMVAAGAGVLMSYLGFSDTALIVFIAVAIGTVGAIVVSSQRISTAHPRSLSIALIGPSRSGKTVYLTMLYDQLRGREERGLTFTAYGTSTIEEVARNLGLIRSGQFPPPTPIDAHFRWEAVASFGSSLVSRRYRISIMDYAGHHLDLIRPWEGEWLHRSRFFEYVLSSDAVLIMVDVERLLYHDKLYTEDPIPALEQILIAAVQTLIEKRHPGGDPTRPSDIPVALLISKSDLLGSLVDERKALARLPGLISVCEQRCKYFKCFFVSSLGTPPKKGKNGNAIPPSHLAPEGIVEPILWILGK